MHYASVPVLMFTGFKTPQLEKEAIAAGCNAVISKSEHQQRLFENIHRLSHQRLRGAARVLGPPKKCHFIFLAFKFRSSVGPLIFA